MDTLFLRDLRIQTVIGIYDWERRIKQTVALDLELACDVRRAAATDAIEDALDYKSLAKRVAQCVETSTFFLVEALAEHVAQTVLKEFPVPWVRVTLSKPGALRGCRDVGVVIERGSRPTC